MDSAPPDKSDAATSRLEALERKVLWLASWMIHNANHIRPNEDGLKVGGHQASCASVTSIMTALYFGVLRPQDRVAVKPHASPVFHAIQYLLGNQSEENLRNFRAYGGAQSYPSRTKDADDVDFSTGSVGLGVAMTSFASMAQDYVFAKEWKKESEKKPKGRMIAVMGDAELDEGNIFEALFEGAKHGLKNNWWIIDYNRHSLDGVVSEHLHDRITGIFQTLGWDVVTLKYGHKLEAVFAEPGGEDLRTWIDDCPNQLYEALTFQGGEAWRKHLKAELGADHAIVKRLSEMDDDAVADLMTNLGGHDIPALLETFHTLPDDRPVCVIAYTIKGYNLPFKGHKDNHAGIMTPDQMAAFKKTMGIRDDHEWSPLEGLEHAEALQAYLASHPFNADGLRRRTAERIDVPDRLDVDIAPEASTQDAFGRTLLAIAKQESELSERILTMSPDVTSSTNLGSWVNRQGVFALDDVEDTFRTEDIPSPQKWIQGPKGQHLELGIAENNLFTALAAFGLSHSLFGERIIPVGALYDIFIQRGLDALNYACYQDARFILAGTPSGISLAPEGGAHQSIGTQLIGMAQDGLAAFEPAHADELLTIVLWALDYVQRDGEKQQTRSWLRDEMGGSVYLRLSTRKIPQPKRTLSHELKQQIVDGGYWLRPPGPGCEVIIAYQGAIAPEAVQAAGLIAEDRRDVGVLAVTSADRLNAGWHAAKRARREGDPEARCYVEELLDPLPRHTGIITVTDGHPAALSWLGGVYGHAVHPMGVEHFGQSGTISDLYHHYGIDTDSIVKAAQVALASRPVRYSRS